MALGYTFSHQSSSSSSSVASESTRVEQLDACHTNGCA